MSRCFISNAVALWLQKEAFDGVFEEKRFQQNYLRWIKVRNSNKFKYSDFSNVYNFLCRIKFPIIQWPRDLSETQFCHFSTSRRGFHLLLHATDDVRNNLNYDKIVSSHLFVFTKDWTLVIKLVLESTAALKIFIEEHRIYSFEFLWNLRLRSELIFFFSVIYILCPKSNLRYIRHPVVDSRLDMLVSSVIFSLLPL